MVEYLQQVNLNPISSEIISRHTHTCDSSRKNLYIDLQNHEIIYKRDNKTKIFLWHSTFTNKNTYMRLGKSREESSATNFSYKLTPTIIKDTMC